jgi:hypothetical protein
MLSYNAARALHVFEMHKKFGDSVPEQMWKLVNVHLTRFACELATIREYEQRLMADGDTALKPFVDEKRSNVSDRQPSVLYKTGRLWCCGAHYSQKLQNLSAFLSRLQMATFGGLVLLVPMLIIVLHPTKLTALVTTVVCVLFVGVVLSFYMRKAEDKDILSATAAYAAVLVVFVGTSTTTSELSDGVIGAISGGLVGVFLTLIGVLYFLFYTKSICDEAEGAARKAYKGPRVNFW